MPAGTDGTGSFQITGYPPGEGPGSGGGSGGSGGSDGNPGSPGSVDVTVDMVKPDEVVLESAKWSKDSVANLDAGLGGAWEVSHEEGSYSATGGGIWKFHFEVQDTNQIAYYTSDTTYNLGPNQTILAGHFTDSYGHDDDLTNGFPTLTIALEIGSLSGKIAIMVQSWSKTSQVKRVLHLGGKSMAGGEVLVEVTGGSGTEELATPPYNQDIAVTNLTVEGLGKALSADGTAYGKAASGSPVSVNLNAKAPFHAFNDGAGSHSLDSVVFGCGLPVSRARIGIGEVAHCFMTGNFSVNWSVTGGGSISSTSGPNTNFKNHSPSTTSTIHAEKDGDELTKTFTVIAPDSITVVGLTNKPLGTANSNGSQMGARTDYTIVIGPTNVSFENATIRENLPLLSLTWPNGTNEAEYSVGTTNGASISCSPGGDFIKDGPKPISYLFNGTNYVDFSFDYTWTYQYQNEAGAWVDFKTMNTHTAFRGSDKQCQETYLGVPGSWQGPYNP